MRAAAPRSGVASASIATGFAATTGARRRRCRYRWQRRTLVVGEELSPTLGDRIRIGEKSVVHVVNQPRVGPKRAMCGAVAR